MRTLSTAAATSLLRARVPKYRRCARRVWARPEDACSRQGRHWPRRCTKTANRAQGGALASLTAALLWVALAESFAPTSPRKPRRGVNHFLERRLARPFGAPTKAVIQRSTTSWVAFVIATDDWRFASATAFPRAAPTVALAALSQALKNGFFFNQGFRMVTRRWDGWPAPSYRRRPGRPCCQAVEFAA